LEGVVKVLVINTGSSTVKISLIESEGETIVFEGIADWTARLARLEVHVRGAEPVRQPLDIGGTSDAVLQVLTHLSQGDRPLIADPREVAAVGHRVVHGGDVYTAGVRVTPEVQRRLSELAELAPVHNPINLEGITAAQSAWPHVPHVAVFDTAFHASMPEAARTYAIPYDWTTKGHLRRYGFHGLSYAYCASRAAELLKRGPQGLRLVICHLGNGASVGAVRDGVSMDISMGFTPLEGLVMGSRSGSVDPGLLLYVLRHRGTSVDDLDRILNRESGLLGISGMSADMRQVLAAANSGIPRARLALDVYIHRLRKTIAAMTASLGGLDALVFTAGVGEHAAPVRAAACRAMEFLGIELDLHANEECRPDADIAAAQSRVRVLVIATREDLSIVRETVRVLHNAG
jgi:acetate kinase